MSKTKMYNDPKWVMENSEEAVTRTVTIGGEQFVIAGPSLEAVEARIQIEKDWYDHVTK